MKHSSKFLLGGKKKPPEAAEKADSPLPKMARAAEKKRFGKRSDATKSFHASRKRKQLVFFLGDEGGILVATEGRTVIKRLFASNTDPDNIASFRQLIAEHPDAPIYALVDMMDQSYAKQTLPPVTRLSVHKIIKRRLERDYAPEDITGALPLGREGTGSRKEWLFLMVSLAASSQLMQWLDFILEWNNPFEGFYLVPVESAAIMRELSMRTVAKNAHSWQLLVCHTKVGGFRQVIMRDGKLIFTRLAHPLEDSSPEVIAGSVEQEISNTIEYLKRLSYSEDQGLDCFLIISAEIKKHIDPKRIKADNLVVLSPFETAELLSLSKAALPEDHYADVVFASFFAMLRRKVLPLHSRISKVLAQYRQWGKLCKSGAAVAAALFVAFFVYQLTIIIPQSSELDDLEVRLQEISKIVEAANTQNSTLPKNIDVLEDIVSLEGLFTPHQSEILDFIKTFQQAAAGDVIVKKLSWKNEAGLEALFNQLPPKYKISLDVEFVESKGTVDAFAKKAHLFFDRCHVAFPQMTFIYSKLPGMIDQAQSFQADFKNLDSNKSQDMLSGEPIVVTLEFTSIPPEGVAAP
jgi:hypothetical protein